MSEFFCEKYFGKTASFMSSTRSSQYQRSQSKLPVENRRRLNKQEVAAYFVIIMP